MGADGPVLSSPVTPTVQSADVMLGALHEALTEDPNSPDGKGGGVFESQDDSGARRRRRGNITWHGGPVMHGIVHLYYVWYGDWTGDTTPAILTDFAQAIGGSPWFQINKTYSDRNGAVSGDVEYGGATTDAYSRGTSLSDDAVEGVIADALSDGRLPVDPNGVYFVLASADVAEVSGFCSKYCGWHNHAQLSGADIKFGFIGDARRCPVCAAQSTGPNGNLGADAAASVIAHELAEAVSDPDLNAWYDGKGDENADKCAWNFGDRYTVANGATANIQIGGRDYLIQQNWANIGSGHCAMSLTTPVPPSLADWGFADRRWMADFNGDGKADYCRAVGNSSGAGSYLACALSTGIGLESEYSTMAPVDDWGYADRRWMVDFNGDGKADYCRAVGKSSGSGSYLACSLSTGDGLESHTVKEPVADWGYADRRWMVDFDGDGKADYCRAVGKSSGAGSYLACARSTGDGLESEYTVMAPVADWGYAGRRWMADFNGDGRADFCRAVGNGSGAGSYFACAFSTGDGLASEYSSMAEIGDWGFADRRWVVDFDGDGRADYCRAVGISSGSGSYFACALSTGADIASEYSVMVPVDDWGYGDRRWVIDFDGDGRAEYMRAIGATSGPGSYLYQY
jgi:hypothetical protein